MSVLNNTICSPTMKANKNPSDIFSNKRSSLPAVNLTKSYLDQIANPFHMYSNRKFKKKKQIVNDYDKGVLEDVQKFKIDK